MADWPWTRRAGFSSQRPGLGAFPVAEQRAGSGGWCVTELCGDAGVSIPSSKPRLLAASQDGRDGGRALLEAEHSHHALPYHSRGICNKTGDMGPVLCLCCPYLQQAPGTNSLMFTKPLGKAVRQIKGRKATIKDYQTPSLPGERPEAIHF